MAIKDYKELDVWKKGIDIVDLIYGLTDKFPKEEKFGLAAHMQKTAISIPANVAEGFARQYTKEYRNFLFIARGSCAELETQTIIAKRRGYIDGSDFEKLVDFIDHESKMLMNLIKVLKQKHAT